MIDIDLSLLEKVQSGDSEAFTNLVKKYTSYVYRTAFAFLHDPLEAEDVSQEVFLKIHRSISSLNEIQAFPAWLKKIITNICLDRLKKRHPIPTQDIGLDIPSSDSTTQWDRNLLLREALKRLSPEYREVLVLREWEGYDYSEIATILAIPLGTVKSRLHTARSTLKKILVSYQD